MGAPAHVDNFCQFSRFLKVFHWQALKRSHHNQSVSLHYLVKHKCCKLALFVARSNCGKRIKFRKCTIDEYHSGVYQFKCAVCHE